MLDKLSTRWAGKGHIRYEKQMTSTNIVAKEMALHGAPHGSLALCDDQTAGRGRMQRVWQTPPCESLTQSLILRPKITIDQLPMITLLAAMSACEAIEHVCPELKTNIKWPNDGIVNDRKCVGILCEIGMKENKLDFVIAGVGINVLQSSFPDEIAQKATSLYLESGRKIDRWELLTAYLEAMEKHVDALENGQTASLLAAYQERCITIGRPVRILSPTEEYVAFANAVDEQGALLVTSEDGQNRRVLCGDVSVRGLMGYIE